ncbi:MAG: class I SAM-dependent methyltransferase [Verrucomicrobia bacterium]|nr:class I SAM-dependent methyltransferase [Verrucomicrobiota bacterium]
MSKRLPANGRTGPTLDEIQQAAQSQFSRQSHCYAQGHILENVDDVRAAISTIALAPASHVLDVATGAGHTGLYLASLGHHVTLADISPAMLARASEAATRRNLKVQTRTHPAEQFPYSYASFDLVTCRVAAHHFSSPESFVRETARVLKSPGHLLLIDGSVADDQPGAEAWLHDVEKLRDPSHHRLLTPRAWIQICEANGLKVTQAILRPFKQPDLNWYFDTAATPTENREQVRSLVAAAPQSARELFRLAEEDGKIVWWWQRLTLIATK